MNRPATKSTVVFVILENLVFFLLTPILFINQFGVETWWKLLSLGQSIILIAAVIGCFGGLLMCFSAINYNPLGRLVVFGSYQGFALWATNRLATELAISGSWVGVPLVLFIVFMGHGFEILFRWLYWRKASHESTNPKLSGSKIDG